MCDMNEDARRCDYIKLGEGWQACPVGQPTRQGTLVAVIET